MIKVDSFGGEKGGHKVTINIQFSQKIQSAAQEKGSKKTYLDICQE